MKIVIQNVFWMLAFVAYQYLCLAKDQITFGVISNQPQSQEIFPINSTTNVRFNYRRPLDYHSVFQEVPEGDSYEAHDTFCSLLAQEPGVAAILNPQETPTTPLLESTSATLGVPFVSTVWSEEPYESLGSVLNFHPDPAKLAKGIAELVKNLQWKSFVLIYEDEAGLLRMQEVLKLQEYTRDGKKNNIVLKKLGEGPDYRPLLKQINGTDGNVLLDCRTEVILPLLYQAKELKLLDLQDSYFLTSLDAHTLDFSGLDTTANITTIRIFSYKSKEIMDAIFSWETTGFDLAGGKRVIIDSKSVQTGTALMHDAITFLTETIEDLNQNSPIEVKVLDCYGSERFDDGSRVIQAMIRRTDFVGLTGPIGFDEFGNRNDFNIYAVDVQSDQLIGIWHASNESLTLTRSDDDAIDAAVAVLQKITVIVTSKLGSPYLMLATAKDGNELVGNARYKGYSMDLMTAIAREMGFKFEFRLAEDKKYGNFDEKTGRWTGLVGDLVERRAHLGICDLTITHERREAVDFSMPFMTLGISILYKKPDTKEIDMFAFMDPFHISVWIYTATLYLLISVVLYFISRMTPGDWESPHPCDENPEELENIWDIKNCLWLTLGSIMTQGCDILPKGVSSRLAVSMWWFFSLIMTSSYTANLAAFLTKANLEAPIDSAEALAKQTKIKYGLLSGGSTESFFKNSNVSTYQRMWTNMLETKPSVFVKENKEGVSKVQNTRNALYAFLMESTGIEYQIETKCDLKQIGNWLDSKSYGIAMPLNAAYRTHVNKAVLKLQESGELATLKEKWWKKERDEKSCDEGEEEEEDGADLALKNVGGVFILLGIGVVLSFALAIMEFLWNVRTVSVEEHLTYCEALLVELKFAFSFWITRKRTKPQISESSSSSSSIGSGNSDNKSMIKSIIGSFMNLNSLPVKLDRSN